MLGVEVQLPIQRMTWKEAMNRFGSDKPDLRFGMELVDVSETVKDTEFVVFKGALENGGSVRGINAKGQGAMPRKKIDKLVEFAKGYGAKGLAYIAIHEDGSWKSSFSKFMTEEQMEALIKAMDGQAGDLLLFAADRNKIVWNVLGALRLELAEQMGLLDKNEYRFVWITEFPLLEWSDEENRFTAMHHPFTMPMDEDLPLLDTDPGAVRAKAYDIVLNGTEIGGGSVRIHQNDVQEKMFEMLGFTKAQAHERFGFLLDAFKYIRSYIPYRQFALRNYYQWGMPSNKAWDKLVLGGHNTNPDWAQTFNAHPAEMLFDLEKDPGELHNLSDSPEYAEVLAKMRKALSEHIRSTKDLGFFMPTSRVNTTLYDKVRKEKYPLNELYNLVELAGTAKASDASVFEKALSSQYPEMRYWASVGLAQLGIKGELQVCPPTLLTLMNDADPYIACEAAYAAAYLGETSKGIERLNHPAKEADRKVGYSLLECLSLDKAMQPAIRTHLADLKEKAEILPRKANEDAGLMARGILVNLGEMDIKDLHGPESYKLGLKLNHGRRPMVPLPN